MLTRHGSQVLSVFDLLGRHEPALTAAIGWVLSHSPSMLQAFLDHLGGGLNPDEVEVSLEEADALGRTDIELTTPTAKIIIEAKKGWLIPDEGQLSRYTDRFEGFSRGWLVSMSDSSEQWAADQLPKALNGIPVVHIAWDTLRTYISAAKQTRRLKERGWLNELEIYMGTATSTRAPEDNQVFCVVVSDTLFGGLTFRDYVMHERAYFHPYGGNNGWPKVPPNFLCFRWEGQVRQVNRVERFEVVPSLTSRWPAMTREEAPQPHIVYELGPDIPIPHIKTAGTYANGRVWCFLDQLLTLPTLIEACNRSKELLGRPLG